jgi:hypothetical protein
MKQDFLGVSPSGKATVFGIVIRWFESSHPSQIQGNTLILQRIYRQKVNFLAPANVGC